MKFQTQPILISNYFLFSAGHVFIPKGTYSGQKVTKLLRMETLAKINKTIAKVPEMMFIA